ncbi:hypothetical protein ACLB2K_051340 [Fragaria x ananassa]
MNDLEPKRVLERLKLGGVKIEVDEEPLLRVIESFLNQYLRCHWASMVADICDAIKEELLRSRNTIDADLVRETEEYFKKQGKKKQGMGDEWSDGDEYSDVGSEEVEESSSSSDSEDDVAEGKTEKVVKEEKIDPFKDPTTRKRCIDRLSYLAGKEGMIVKQEDEEAILELMIPHIRDSISYLIGIINFLDRVTEYIDNSCRLDNLETVKTALRDTIFDQVYGQYRVKVSTTVIRKNKP